MIYALPKKPHFRYYLVDHHKWRIYCEEHDKWWTLQQPWNQARECYWCNTWIRLEKLPGIAHRKMKEDDPPAS